MPSLEEQLAAVDAAIAQKESEQLEQNGVKPISSVEQQLAAVDAAIARKEKESNNTNDFRLSDIPGYVRRGVQGAIGSAIDTVPNLVNLASTAIAGKPIVPTISPTLLGVYDQMTDSKYAPTSTSGKIAFDVAMGLGGGAGLGAGAKVIPKIPKAASDFLHKMGRLTAPNIGATVGATTASHLTEDTLKDSPRAHLAATVAGSIAGKKVGKGAAYYHPTEQRERALAGTLGRSVSQHLPEHYGFQSDLAPTTSEIGNLAQKSAHTYITRRKKEFKEKYGTIENEFLKKIDESHSPSESFADALHKLDQATVDRQVSLAAPLGKILDIYEPYSHDAKTASVFAKGPLGALFEQLGGLQARPTPQFLNTLLKERTTNPGILDRKVDYKTAFSLRKQLDNRLSSGEWKEVGGEAEHLRGIRGALMDSYVSKFDQIDPKLGKQLRAVNKDFAHHMQKEVPWVEALRGVRHHAGKSATRALQDLGSTGEDLQRLYRDLSPAEQAKVSSYLLHDLGTKEGNFSAPKFASAYKNLPRETHDVLKKYSEADPALYNRAEDLARIQHELSKLTKPKSSWVSKKLRSYVGGDTLEHILEDVGNYEKPNPNTLAKAIEHLDKRSRGELGIQEVPDTFPKRVGKTLGEAYLRAAQTGS